MSTASRRWAPLVATVLVLSACGVPRDGAVQVVPADEVPFGLASASPDAGGTGELPPFAGSPVVYLLDDDRLVGSALSGASDDPRLALDQVVAALTAGPSATARDNGIGTALPPSLELTITGLRGGLATVDLGGGDAFNVGEQGPLVVGQVVLSVTSVPGVDRVRLTRRDQPVDAQLADGVLTGRPLVPADYRQLVDPAS